MHLLHLLRRSRAWLRLTAVGAALALLLAACESPAAAPESSAVQSAAAAAETTPAAPAPPAPVQTSPPPTPEPTRSAAPTPAPTQAPTLTATPDPTPSPDPTPEPTEAPADGFPLTVQSSDGSVLVLEKPPQRIIAFDSAAVEILFAIGAGDRIAATHDFVSHPPEAAAIPRIGGAFDLNVEAAVALDPDLVFVFFDRFVDDLTRAGLPVLYVETLDDDFTRIAERIRFWGRIVDAQEDAASVAQDFEARVDAIRAAMERVERGPSIFMNSGDFWTPGQGTLMQEVFDLLELHNIADDVEGYVQLGPEAIVERNPAIIVTQSLDDFADPAFRDVEAVTQGAVFTLSTDALSVASQRFVEGIEELARLAYPDLFAESAPAA